jgi:hypothetical protein
MSATVQGDEVEAAAAKRAASLSSLSPSKEGHEMRRTSEIPGLDPRPGQSKKARHDHKGTCEMIMVMMISLWRLYI